MGWVSRELGRGFETPEDRPTAWTIKLEAIKDHPDAVRYGRTLSDLI